jgi:hypothetical protein
MKEEESIFEFVPVVILPECSRRTLAQLAADKEFYRREFVIVRSYSERIFETSYARSLGQWMAEDTRETAGRLAAHVRSASVGHLFVSNN